MRGEFKQERLVLIMNSKNFKKLIVLCIMAIIALQPVTVLANSNRHAAIVVFDPNGGSNSPRQLSLNQDQSGAVWFTIPNQAPQRAGYQFVGWRILNSTSTDIAAPGEKIGLTTGGSSNRAVTFVYLAVWRCTRTQVVQGDSFDAADLMRRGHCYCEMQDIMEAEVLRLVNEIRVEYGLPKLPRNDELAELARARAQESADYGYISGHISHETGLAHTAHAQAMGLDVEFAGENWGGNQRTPAEIVQAWMESPGHRDFLLSGHYTSRFSHNAYMGVGVAFCREGGFITDKNWVLWQMR